jgi:HPt (histidine-containing phosphotransfer) domain-containing protein
LARASASGEADPPSVPESWIDRRRLQELAGELGQDGVAELLASFWRDAGEIVELFRRACGAGDLEAMGQALHTLKGAAANLGIAACVDACERARASLREHGGLEAPALAAALLRAVSESERTLSMTDGGGGESPKRRRARR